MPRVFVRASRTNDRALARACTRSLLHRLAGTIDLVMSIVLTGVYTVIMGLLLSKISISAMLFAADQQDLSEITHTRLEANGSFVGPE